MGRTELTQLAFIHSSPITGDEEVKILSDKERKYWWIIQYCKHDNNWNSWKIHGYLLGGASLFRRCLDDVWNVLVAGYPYFTTVYESHLDCKEIQPVHPAGDWSWVLIGRTNVEAETPVLWPPHAKSWLIGEDPDAGRDWGQEEKGMTEAEMAGWHHWLDGHGFE